MASGLSEKEQLVLKKFRAALERALGKNLVELKLFGSKARGGARKDSDLDVVVITTIDDWHICDVAYAIVTDLLLDDEVDISPKVISKKDYERICKIGNPFVKNVIREEIKI